MVQPGPVQGVVTGDRGIWIKMKQALPALVFRPGVPGDRQSLDAAVRKLDQILLQRVEAKTCIKSVALTGSSKDLHLCCHVGKAADPIGRIATFENPDVMIRLRALCVLVGAERFVTRKALHAYLRREHALRRFAGALREGHGSGGQNAERQAS